MLCLINKYMDVYLSYFTNIFVTLSIGMLWLAYLKGKRSYRNLNGVTDRAQVSMAGRAVWCSEVSNRDQQLSELLCPHCRHENPWDNNDNTTNISLAYSFVYFICQQNTVIQFHLQPKKISFLFLPVQNPYPFGFFFLVFLWFSKKRRGIVFQVCNHSVEMFKIEFRSCACAQIYTAVAANHWLTIISCFPLVFVCPLVRASVTACYLQDKGHCLLVYRGKNVTYIHISHR